MSDAQRAESGALAVHHIAGPIEASLESFGMSRLATATSRTRSCGCSRMERQGRRRRRRTLRSSINRLTAEVESLAAELRQVAGRDDLNLNSPTQLGALLYEGANSARRAWKKTKSALLHRRPDAGEVARPVAGVHRAAVAASRVEKLRGTYGEGCCTRSLPTAGSTRRSTRR
ncbi:MAG: hypothetical protein R2697_17195 [Ilumatobacteraceae bacterium]